MRILFFALLMLLVCPISALAEDYCNPIPVMNDHNVKMDAADPFVMRHNGRYYLYTTGAEEIRVYESENLVDWQYRGWCTQNGDGHVAFAPEVFYWRGAFYMVTSPWGNGHYTLKSDSPLGPFTRVTDNYGYSIDGSLFAADDGTLHMFNLTGGRSISITEMDEDKLIPKGINRATGVTLYHWTEGPGLIRRGEWNYLTFTGNHYLSEGYRVAWASRKGDPIGRYTQRDDHTLLINSVFKDKFTGLGHSANFYGPDLDSIYTSYHCHAPEQTGGGLVRWYCLDRLLTNGGALYSTGPSNFPMPVPAMPDVYGDAQGELRDFAVTGEGFLADVPAAVRFTQECNFTLTGGSMAWRMGSREGKPACITTDGRTIAFTVDGGTIAEAAVPELGEMGRLHTLRVECTPDILYVYIDAMRLLTVESPAVTADAIGAITGENVTYSFLAHTAKALGDSDDTAVKAIPGRFAAVHAVNSADLTAFPVGDMEEEAVLLGDAAYNVRIAAAGAYCFDLTVRREDAGKTIALALDGEGLAEAVIPAIDAEDEFVTFTTAPIELPQGDHILTLSGEDAAALNVTAFAHAAMPAQAWNLAEGERKGIITLGGFKLEDGVLQVGVSGGFALIGDEGCTDYELRATVELPKGGSGFCGMVLHATDVSVHPDQVAESAFGYAVALTNTGLTIRRLNYGQVGDQHKVKVDGWRERESATLTVRVQNNTLRIYLDDGAEPIFTLREALPYTHGLCGFYSTGKPLRVTDVSVRPLD